MDRLAGIQEFVAVVEAGGFSAAGQKLHLSRSSVGKAVARLEGRLGVRLCHRTTRAFTLTSDGNAFYEHCVRILAELDIAENAMTTDKEQPAGRLRISVPVIFGRHCVAPVIADLARQHSRLRFDVSFTDRPVDLIDEGYDLVVRNTTLPDSAVLTARRIARQRMTICAAPSYLAARGSPREIGDIAEHDSIVYGRDGSTRPWLFPDGKGGTYAAPARTRLILDDLEAAADMAVAGMGLAWLPCWLIRERVASGSLVRVLPDIEPLVFDTYAVWPRAPFMPARMRVLIDALASRLPGMTGTGDEIKSAA
ncbi:LysR family transcriptional regulator [Phyllobacterium myrsinacearum]|uniref:DNA-binding transcriptional LysR family regulator n=1 Tax=Phyllobacterium myrsinacearum TaxID=28101 RepID=A0A839ENP5_9HYPH|nr:LysR family transcriptional regulator [Phyllobacterium myrsinacearum]MBA8880499.1 DNA-binding transcriptional LysR family regulator [Phyllobacterium myrsinacearum]